MIQANLNTIVELLIIRGQQQYDGENVSQLDHALQCAALALVRGASDELITASFLHDVGHLIEVDLGLSSPYQTDHRHEYRAIALLQDLFSPAVTEPIRLHVEAKQYLCAVDPLYWSSLSSAAQHSLEQQGETFSAKDAQRFINQPFAQDAIKLRIWDDQAKIKNAQTPDIEAFVAIAQRCL